MSNLPSNPLSTLGSDVFVRRYKDDRGIWHEERQINLGGQQGTVTYVHVNDYNDAKDEIARLTTERDEWARKAHDWRAKYAELRYLSMKGIVRPADETGEKHG